MLLFVEAEELKSWRWEWLWAPVDGGWDFLALDQWLAYSLYLPSRTGWTFPPIGRCDLARYLPSLYHRLEHDADEHDCLN